MSLQQLLSTLRKVFCSWTRDRKITENNSHIAMELESTLGAYLPSFFSITLNFEHHIDDIREIPEPLKPTFYHEYFHFVQDLTTPYGFHFAWGNMSGVKQAVSILQKKPAGSVTLPISEPERSEIVNQMSLFQTINGDKGLFVPNKYEEVNTEELMLVSFSLELRSEMEPFEKEPQTRFIKLSLQSSNGTIYHYWFGAKAIIEGMAELIQEKHFGETQSPRFPYRIVQDFISFVRPEIRGRKDIMFILCDLALQTNHPGFYLNSLLVNSTLRDLIPENLMDVYRIGFDFYREHHYNVFETFQDYKNKLQINIGELFGHHVFRGELEWLNQVIENGFKLRNEVNTFMLDLYNAEDPFINVLPEVILRLGTPDIVNINYDRVFALPIELRGREEDIHPVLMTALFQFYKDLISARPRCAMVELCRTNADMQVNAKCYHNQWEKIDEKQVCPLMAFYKAFGLDALLKSTETR